MIVQICGNVRHNITFEKLSTKFNIPNRQITIPSKNGYAWNNIKPNTCHDLVSWNKIILILKSAFPDIKFRGGGADA